MAWRMLAVKAQCDGDGTVELPKDSEDGVLRSTAGPCPSLSEARRANTGWSEFEYSTLQQFLPLESGAKSWISWNISINQPSTVSM